MTPKLTLGAMLIRANQTIRNGAQTLRYGLSGFVYPEGPPPTDAGVEDPIIHSVTIANLWSDGKGGQVSKPTYDQRLRKETKEALKRIVEEQIKTQNKASN